MIPPKIGRYQVKRELGRGGMAAVYDAFDPEVEREVAIKVLPREAMMDPNFRARFKREARIIAALEHPAIVPVYDFGEHEGQPYIVMRLMSGGSLQERIKKGRISLRDCAHILSQLAPALDDAHTKGIVHRDLKPGNILFDQRNIPYISDFGIAKLAEATMVLTINGLVGTPAYMSPEQARGESVIDGRSDIYSLGVILFEMLTGKLPYNANTPLELALKHITEPVPRILNNDLALPPDCQRVIDGAMSKDKDERFSTATEMIAMLNAVARGEPVSAAPGPRPQIQSTIAISPPPRAPSPGVADTAEPQRGLPTWMWAIVGFAAILVSACAAVLVLAAITNAPSLTSLLSFLTPASPTAVSLTSTSSPSTPLFTVATDVLTPTRESGLTPTATACPLAYTLQSADPPAGEKIVVDKSFIVTITLLNAGDCAWPAGTTFNFDEGDLLGAPSAIQVSAIEPGQETVITVVLQAPQSAGAASQTWTLRLPDDTVVGEPLQFDFNFAAPTATATRAATRPPVVATAPPPTSPPSSGGPIVVRRVNFVSAVRTGGNNANATLSIEFSGGTGPFTLSGDGILSPQVKNITGTFEHAGVIYSYIYFERITSCGAAVAGTVKIADSAGQSALHLYNVNIVCP